MVELVKKDVGNGQSFKLAASHVIVFTHFAPFLVPHNDDPEYIFQS